MGRPRRTRASAGTSSRSRSWPAPCGRWRGGGSSCCSRSRSPTGSPGSRARTSWRTPRGRSCRRRSAATRCGSSRRRGGIPGTPARSRGRCCSSARSAAPQRSRSPPSGSRWPSAATTSAPYIWVELGFVLATVVLAILLFSRRARRPLAWSVPLLRKVRLERITRSVYEAIHAYRDKPRLLVGVFALTRRRAGRARARDLGGGEGGRRRSLAARLLRDGAAALPRAARAVHDQRASPSASRSSSASSAGSASTPTARSRPASCSSSSRSRSRSRARSSSAGRAFAAARRGRPKRTRDDRPRARGDSRRGRRRCTRRRPAVPAVASAASARGARVPALRPQHRLRRAHVRLRGLRVKRPDRRQLDRRSLGYAGAGRDLHHDRRVHDGLPPVRLRRDRVPPPHGVARPTARAEDHLSPVPKRLLWWQPPSRECDGTRAEVSVRARGATNRGHVQVAATVTGMRRECHGSCGAGGVSWAAHDLEPYAIQKHSRFKIAFVPLLIGSYAPDLFTEVVRLRHPPRRVGAEGATTPHSSTAAGPASASRTRSSTAPSSASSSGKASAARTGASAS